MIYYDGMEIVFEEDSKQYVAKHNSFPRITGSGDTKEEALYELCLGLVALAEIFEKSIK